MIDLHLQHLNKLCKEFVYFHTYLWDNKNYQPQKNVQIRFLEKTKGIYGTKFFSEDNIEPKTGYLRPLMIVVIDRRRV